MSELSFVVYYMDDIVCDMKVFFGIDDPDEELSSAQFFMIAERLPAYKGAVRQRIEIYANDHRDEIEAMQNERKKPKGLDVTADALRGRQSFGASAPSVGQAAPLFEVHRPGAVS